MKIELVLNHDDRQLIHELRRQVKMFADSIKKLQDDVNALVAQGAGAVAAAVAAKDASDAAAVDAVDATVTAALNPAPAAPAA